MGDPIFTTKAHVFQIDPDTKKKWLPSSSQAVAVSFYHDNSRGLFRIISIEGSKILVNSTVTSNMNFTKTSQKFGQWSDVRASTVYGLGFPNEQDLAKFVEKFNEVKEATLHDDVTTSSNANGYSTDGKITPSILKMAASQNDAPPGSSSPNLSDSQQEKLRYENDRLKIALTQSSANAKKWEVELQTLRNNNSRLNTALVESAANVEQWKQQLSSLKEENAILKRKVLENDQSSGNIDGLLYELDEVKAKLQAAEKLTDDKNKELNSYRSKIDELTVIEIQNQKLDKKIQVVEDDNGRLKKDVSELKIQLERSKASGGRGNKDLLALQQQLSTKINEMYVMNDHLADLLQVL